MVEIKRQKLKYRFVILIPFFIIFLLPFTLGELNTLLNTNGFLSSNKEIDSNKLQLIPLTNFSNITITGDNEFSTWASDFSWQGNGLSSSPYVIANYNIINSGIYIADTRVYFILENITISQGSSSSGLKFLNVTNSIVRNVAVLPNLSIDGFDLFTSYNNSFINCSTTSNNNGFSLTTSWNNTLINSSASNSGNRGIFLITHSDNNTLINNIALNNFIEINTC